MIEITTICDAPSCDKKERGEPSIALRGKFERSRGGILLPPNEFHFCSDLCLMRFMASQNHPPRLVCVDSFKTKEEFMEWAKKTFNT